MGFAAARSGAALLLTLAGCLAAPASNSTDAVGRPDPGLLRVIVLGRHGNRAPNPEVEQLCPNFAQEVLHLFGVAPAALSRVGMSECQELGRFLRARYTGFLPPGGYQYDKTYTFFAERATRNIVSTVAATRGMFPDGTGIPGFASDRPNLVPIATTQAGADTLLNCPRDGPCAARLKQDLKQWSEDNEARVYEEHKELFQTLSNVCGADLKPGSVPPRMDFIAAVKDVSDALVFAETEGLDHSLSGRLDDETFQRFHGAVENIVRDSYFGQASQLTYWTADFLPTVFRLARLSSQEPSERLHFFLNHRELLYALAHMLGIPLSFPGHRKDTLPTGSALVMEVYASGVKLYMWTPDTVPWQLKASYVSKNLPVADLYSGHGTLVPVPAAGCQAGEVCPLKALEDTFDNFTRSTGTWRDLCTPEESGLITGRPRLKALGGVPRSGGARSMEWLTGPLQLLAVAAAAGSAGWVLGRRSAGHESKDLSRYLLVA